MQKQKRKKEEKKERKKRKKRNERKKIPISENNEIITNQRNIEDNQIVFFD